jgi:hypothetical protein
MSIENNIVTIIPQEYYDTDRELFEKFISFLKTVDIHNISFEQKKYNTFENKLFTPQNYFIQSKPDDLTYHPYMFDFFNSLETNNIYNSILKHIIKNRIDNELVRNSLNSSYELELKIEGLNDNFSPKRTITVPANMTLNMFFDKIICPCFGWLRGKYDYLFYIPESIYPRIPTMPIDVIFSSIINTPNFNINNRPHTYRNVYTSRIPDSLICLADLLQKPDQYIYNVLTLHNWKISIIVKNIIPNHISNINVIDGKYTNISANILGPQIYTLYIELLRQANISGNIYERNYILNLLRESNTFMMDYKSYTDIHICNLNINTIKNNIIQSSDSKSKYTCICNTCHLTSNQLKRKLKLCSRCNNIRYCSSHCQQLDWKNHKIICTNYKYN